MTMKALCFSLVAALCFGLAFSRQCYKCETTAENCMNETTCAEEFCQTEVIATPANTTVKKSCIAACGTPFQDPAAAAAAGVTLKFYDCCNTDLCNQRVSSGGVKVSFSGLSLALGLSAMLVRAVL